MKQVYPCLFVVNLELTPRDKDLKSSRKDFRCCSLDYANSS